MKKLKTIWTWLNNKKRNFALIYWSIITPSLVVIYPSGIPSTLNKAYIIVGIVLSAVGVTHAVAKERAAKLERDQLGSAQ